MSEPRTAESIEALIEWPHDIDGYCPDERCHAANSEPSDTWQGSSVTEPSQHSVDCRIAKRNAALTAYADAMKAQTWQGMESAPKDRPVLFWVRPKTADESYTNTSGDPILSHAAPRLYRGKFKTWSALETATHWMEDFAPAPPSDRTEGR